MSSTTVSEQEILEALHRVPTQRWSAVLNYLGTLQTGGHGGSATGSVYSAAELAQSELMGIWADRTDIGDSQAFARQLREMAEHRHGAKNAAGH
jgi:hypothetical protein